MYSSTIIIGVMRPRRIRWAERVACIMEPRRALNISVGKPEGKGSFKISGHKWECNIKNGS
jgi:hypothetical protein